MPDEAELEILLRKDLQGFTVELRLSQPDDEEVRTPVGGAAPLDPAKLRPLRNDPDKYGRELGRQLLSDADVKAFFKTAWAVTEQATQSLRVRLFINRSAPELHELRWETLRDPDDGSWLLTKTNLFFSRFLSSDDWKRVRLRRKPKLRGLVVIANPSALADPAKGYFLEGRRVAEVPVKGELKRAEAGLAPVVPETLVSDPAAAVRVTLDRIANELDRGYDILYLVCHGALRKSAIANNWEPLLLLEKDDGQDDVRSGTRPRRASRCALGSSPAGGAGFVRAGRGDQL